jgi:hypothetical protein
MISVVFSLNILSFVGSDGQRLGLVLSIRPNSRLLPEDRETESSLQKFVLNKKQDDG